MSWSVEGASVVATNAAPRGASPFDRGRPILALADGSGALLLASRVSADGVVDGEPLTADDLDDLVESGEAIRLRQSLPPRPGAAFWSLRGNFELRYQSRRELEGLEALIASEVSVDGDLLLYVDEQRGGTLRDTWGRRAVEQAKRFLAAGDGARALEEAWLAFAVFRQMQPEAVALVSIVEGRRGDEARASGIIAVARNTEGDAFAAQVEEARLRIERELDLQVERRVEPRSGQRVAEPRLVGRSPWRSETAIMLQRSSQASPPRAA